MIDFTHQYEPNPDRNQESYSLSEAEPAAPDLPGNVVTALTADELIDRVGADLVVHAENCVRQFGDFHLALARHATLEPLYERLMYDPNFRRLPWRRTHLWFVEEPRVELHDARSSFHAINETIGEHADIPRDQFHPIFALADTAADDYEAAIKEALSWREKGQDRLDCALLALGDDGHVGGLYPFSSALHEPRRFVSLNACPNTDPNERITMTFPLLNAARLIGVFASGVDKREIIERVASREHPVETLPAMGLSPLQGELRWYLDADATPGDVTGDLSDAPCQRKRDHDDHDRDIDASGAQDATDH